LREAVGLPFFNEQFLPPDIKVVPDGLVISTTISWGWDRCHCISGWV